MDYNLSHTWEDFNGGDPAEKTRDREGGPVGSESDARAKTALAASAQIKGTSLTDFVLGSANEAAYRVVRENDVLELARKDCEIFVKALLNPPPPNQKLRQAFARYKEIAVK